MSGTVWLCLLMGCLLGAECSKDECVYIDNICLNSWDVANYEAIRTLHAHLDDDHNGDIDLSESVEFLREELNYTKEAERRQNFFHPNNDNHISVKELWTMWLDSEVHNWTVENTVSWLCLSVDLAQYAQLFQKHSVNGSLLPRMATSNDLFLTRTLGIKNPAHRSKIAIKAMDVVLFGPPKDTGSYFKDITIALLITFLIIGAFRFYHVQKDFDRQRNRMVQEMESLNAEEKKFREELHLKNCSFDEVNGNTVQNEANPEKPPSDTTSASVKWDDDCDSTATNETQTPLQMWLQLSYEREKAAFDYKCQLVEAQLCEAKELCEKLNPSKKSFFMTLGLVHGKSEPKYDTITLAVRDSIAEIKLLNKEMDFRWKAIEKWVSCEITTNAGLSHLEFLLEPDIHLPSKANPATVGLGQSAAASSSSSGFKSASVMPRKRKKEHRMSPDTGSIRSTSSLPAHSSQRSVNSIQRSETIATALGSDIPELPDGSQDSILTTDGQDTNHVPAGITQTNGSASPQLSSGEPRKDGEESKPGTGAAETTATDCSAAGNSSAAAPPVTSPQVRSRIKPFFKSYSEDADDLWPPRMVVGGKNDNKFKSEPTLETEVRLVTKHTDAPLLNGRHLRQSIRKKIFGSSGIFRAKSKLEKSTKSKSNAPQS